MLRDVYSDQLACLDAGNAQVAPIDAQWADLDKNWNPSGYFEPAAIREAVAAVQDIMSSAFDALSQAKTTCDAAPGCDSSSYTWQSDYGKLYDLVTQGQNYLDAANQAESAASAAFKTPYVIATGLKKWAIDALIASSNAFVDSSMVACNMPWWIAAVANLTLKAAAAGAVLERIAGVAADVVELAYKTGKAVVQTAAETFNLVSWAINNLPLLVGATVLIFGGSYVWKNREKLKAGVSRLKLKRGTAAG